MREKHLSVASRMCLTGDQTCNQGPYPDRESNRRTLLFWGDAQPTGLHLSGQSFLLLKSSRFTEKPPAKILSF